LLSLVYEEREKLSYTAASYLSDGSNARMSAAWLLGDLRTDRAVEALLDHIDLEDPRHCVDTRPPLYRHWPALEALVKIGDRAAEFAVYRLAKGVKDTHRDLMLWLIWRIHGIAGGARYLERSGEHEEDPRGRLNLAVAT